MIYFPERKLILSWIEEALVAGARLRKACDILGISPRTVQRWQKPAELVEDGRSKRQFVPANKLSQCEREQLLEVANSDQYADLPPTQIVPILAEQGQYIASESTFYRVLREEKLLQHRQASRPSTEPKKPDPLTADGPNQLYSWDITYLPQSIKGMFFYLYLFMDIFSRKIVGWQVYEQESSELASEIMIDISRREGIAPDQVTLHSDNGGPMKGATMLSTLQKLGVVPSFSRPSVSNDNPFSESLFRTMKYCPEYPEKPFSDLQHARVWVEGFVVWYNHKHRHSALKFVTPAQRHAGLDTAILERRKQVYKAARAKNPERWSGDIRNWTPKTMEFLNPVKSTEVKEDSRVKKAA
jgi:transposase InsO family protein